MPCAVLLYNLKSLASVAYSEWRQKENVIFELIEVF